MPTRPQGEIFPYDGTLVVGKPLLSDIGRRRIQDGIAGGVEVIRDIAGTRNFKLQVRRHALVGIHRVVERKESAVGDIKDHGIREGDRRSAPTDVVDVVGSSGQCQDSSIEDRQITRRAVKVGRRDAGIVDCSDGIFRDGRRVVQRSGKRRGRPGDRAAGGRHLRFEGKLSVATRCLILYAAFGPLAAHRKNQRE